MTAAVCLMAAAYVVFLVWENLANLRARQSFLHVIHVNGTRGKTGTARMIDAFLRAGGYRVFTKTTGSDAACIDVNGEERRIRRIGPASVSEQFRILRRAAAQGAQILVIECMAVNPELQKVCQEKIVNGDMNVITNVRYDHLFEMGPKLGNIAEALSAVVPENGLLFTADRDYYDFFAEKCSGKNSRCVLCGTAEAEDENLALALAVAAELGIDESVCRSAVREVKADYGTKKIYSADGHTFYNFFSANDPQSSLMLMKKYCRDTGTPVFVYNNREDRPDRVLAFAEHFFHRLPGAQVLVTGQCRRLCCRLLRKAGAEPHKASPEEIIKRLKDNDLIGIGNIKGEAEKILALLEGVSEK